MRPDYLSRCISFGSCVLACAGIGLAITPAVAKSKKAEEAAPDSCIVDTTIRTADPNLLKRFRSLAGCEDQLLVAPASELDFVEPDGRVIIAEKDDGESLYADDKGEDGYRLQYADMKPGQEIEDDDADEEEVNQDARKPKKAQRAAQHQPAKRKGTEVEIYSYGGRASPVSLSGTGTVVRIIPEETPPQATAGQSYAPGYAPGTAPQSGGSSGILAMRPQSYRTRFDDIISHTAQNHRIDPLLLHAVIQQESGYRHTVRSHAGAQGLMQIMPGTGRLLGVQPAHLNDPTTNVDAGARLLRRLYYKYDGNFDLVLAAYNAGEGAVQKYGNRVPPYRETQDYVKKVMQRYNKLLAEQSGMAPRP
jgi:soluble lytic murein transglycosylase-like protein